MMTCESRRDRQVSAALVALRAKFSLRAMSAETLSDKRMDALYERCYQVRGGPAGCLGSAPPPFTPTAMHSHRPGRGCGERRVRQRAVAQGPPAASALPWHPHARRRPQAESDRTRGARLRAADGGAQPPAARLAKRPCDARAAAAAAAAIAVTASAVRQRQLTPRASSQATRRVDLMLEPHRAG